MIKFSRANKYILIMLLIILNLIIRVPTTQHEHGIDSMMIHQLANFLSLQGSANWILNPLSFFGLYPFSTPSSVIFLLSGLSQVSGMGLTYTILLMAISIGLFAIFTSFIAAREIVNDDVFIFLVCSMFSLSPLFLRFTIWTASTRNLFMVLSPLFLWLMFRSYSQKTNKSKYLLLFSIIFILMGTTHHMMLLLTTILIAFCIAVLYSMIENNKYGVKNRVNITCQKIVLNAKYRVLIGFWWLTIFILLLLPQLFQWGFYKDFNIWYDYQSGFFWHGTTPGIIFLNMLIDYASRIGILFVFGILGVLYLTMKFKKNVYDRTILFALLSIAPISTFGLYISSFHLFIFCILIGFGLIWSFEHKKVKIFLPHIVAACIILTVLFSLFMLFHWGILGYSDNQMTDATQNVGMFVGKYTDENVVSMSNSKLIGRQISIVSSTHFFEDKGYVLDLACGLENSNNFSIHWSGLSGLLSSTNMPYIESNISSTRNYIKIMSYDVNNKIPKDLLTRYRIQYVVEHMKIQGMFVGSSRLYDSVFVKSLPEKKDTIYNNGEECIWILNTKL